ncbi:MAG: 3-phosphoglycerate dehydrogenase [Gammaproteobacteria bacterium]|nr:MAG: 3-phosphoglycerate dehydrogenase [Gammaproteobacteria bacterium]
MYKIMTRNAIAAIGLNQFPSAQYEVGESVSSPDAIMLRSHVLTEADLSASVQAIGRAGAGVNNIPVAACTERGIPVFNAPGANANAVKELVLAGLLLGSRGILEGIQYVDTLQAETDHKALSKTLEKEKKRFAGSEIQGKTLGVVGLGAIGSMVANAALKLGMEVVGYDPALSVEAAWRLPSEVKRMENLNSLYARADFITLHLPVFDSTRGMVNKDAVAAMKKGVKLLNFAREEIVDLPSVIAGLESGKIGRYITDFPAPGLIGRKDVILMPHIGASTEEAEENCAVMVARQLRDFLENGNIVNSVNFPALTLERSGKCRLAIANRNVPKMLGKILSILADQNINVTDMLNKSRDDVAYNLIDMESMPSDAALNEIRQTEGVISVRVIC